MSQRLVYQKQFASGRVVNIGCGEVPVDFGPDTVQVDMDKYDHKNFVQADAHNLPFKDDEFDTAVLGDIVEHSINPAQMLREAGRVAKKVVATIYEEWRLEEMGGSVEAYVDNMKKDIKKAGFNSHYDYLKSLPVHKEHIIEVVEDTVDNPHHPHVQAFTEESLKKVIEDSGLNIIIFTKFQEGIHEGHVTYNWLLVANKGE
jgi:ubiquinone/menaquinone biosynthesis C-methylase UbiE